MIPGNNDAGIYNLDASGNSNAHNQSPNQKTDINGLKRTHSNVSAGAASSQLSSTSPTRCVSRSRPNKSDQRALRANQQVVI